LVLGMNWYYFLLQQWYLISDIKCPCSVHAWIYLATCMVEILSLSIMYSSYYMAPLCSNSLLEHYQSLAACEHASCCCHWLWISILLFVVYKGYHNALYIPDSTIYECYASSGFKWYCCMYI
jgi:hypothetical protein